MKSIATTSKWEIWSWYAYYVGANGIGPFNFAPTAFQNLLAQAAADNSSGLGNFAGRRRDTNSIVLLCNGLAFAIQTALFLIIGAYADSIFFVLSLLSASGIFMFLDLDKGAKEQNAFLREKAVRVYGVPVGTDGDGDGNKD